MKKGLIIIIGLLITGCSENIKQNSVLYDLDINSSFNEKIIISLDKDAYEIADKYSLESGTYTSLEYTLLKADIYPITTDPNTTYQKEIKEENNQINVILKHNYKEDDYLNEGYIYRCFENYSLDSNDDYFEVSLSGKFYCLNDFTEINISINSNYEVLDHNSNNINKTKYSWIIDDNNKDNVNIHYKIQRNYEDMDFIVKENTGSFSNIIITTVIGIFVVLLLSFMLVYLKKKTN